MSTVLKNYVTVKRTRGDVLHPTAFRSVVEMIRGIIKKYDYAGFNDTYKEFLKHLTDLDDPHNVTGTSFYEEIIEIVYAVYVKMTPTPLTEEDFRLEIVPSLKFLELLRRIVLNHWVYTQVKNPDGSVPAVITVVLGEDWGTQSTGSLPTTVNFGSVLTDEDAFIARGWTSPSTPRSVVFNAIDLEAEHYREMVIFHTSTESPYGAVGVSSFGYPINITGSSNDLTIKIAFQSAPVITTTLFSILNLDDLITIAVTAASLIEIRFNNVVVMANIACGDGRLSLTMTKSGALTLVTYTNGIKQTTQQTVDFSGVVPFSVGLVGVALVTGFSTGFGLKELGVYKDTYDTFETPQIMPMLVYTPPAQIIPIVGFATAAKNTQSFSPEVGYKLYLTLTGTWVGSVTVQGSLDNGVTWNALTSHGGGTVGVYTTNCDEAVLDVTSTAYKYRLSLSISSGQVDYRLAQ